jgi:hypothetical protein
MFLYFVRISWDQRQHQYQPHLFSQQDFGMENVGVFFSPYSDHEVCAFVILNLIMNLVHWKPITDKLRQSAYTNHFKLQAMSRTSGEHPPNSRESPRNHNSAYERRMLQSLLLILGLMFGTQDGRKEIAWLCSSWGKLETCDFTIGKASLCCHSRMSDHNCRTHTRILNLRSPGHVWANLINPCCSLISLAKNFVSACKTSIGNSTVERQHRFDSLLL